MIIASQPKLSLNLNASDTTDIHRGGMTGLWMSLKRLERRESILIQASVQAI
jgi:hypothetical protein